LHRTRVIQRGVTLAAALGSTLVATLALSPHVLADQSPYTATASAAALRYSLADPQIIPLLQGGEIDISSPMAQVAADTVGGGQGIASLLYPGDDIVGIGGLIGSALPPGTPAPQLPPYPVTVKADPGTPNPPSQQAPPSAGCPTASPPTR